VSFKIYVEGGGDAQRLRTDCRKGFRLFFQNAGLHGKMPAVVACGPRDDAFDSFCTAIKKSDPSELPLLLVDSEEEVSKSSWEHLSARDGWDKPEEATDNHVYLMVQCMEAWFLADPECLKSYFGDKFRESALSGNLVIESIAKVSILNSLKMSTRDATTKGEYNKGKHSFEILGKIDPKKVESASPHAKKLLDKLR